MTALLVVLLFAGFVLTDVVVRYAMRRLEQARARREREAVLATQVHLDFSHEAPSLKRVEVPHPKGTILAIDDEPVVLDSLRKILVLDGFSVDTVESGREALGLVQRRDYDLVLTDLKMPEMDGVEVVKAVKHLRPDMDIAVITGYGTIETAVETMQHGAADYVQKPFTADELSAFVNRLWIKRQARLEAQRRPQVRVVAPAVAAESGREVFCVAGGAFLCEGHSWARLEPEGTVRVGLDDFARKALGRADRVELPARDREVRQGDALFAVGWQDRIARVPAPLSGKVVALNDALRSDPQCVMRDPYDGGWVCVLQPADLAAELPALRIGQAAVDWYQKEIERFVTARQREATDLDWQRFEAEFLQPSLARGRGPHRP